MEHEGKEGGQKRKERGDRGSPDRCDAPAKIGRTAYANATVWPWWNAVKSDGANRREKTVTIALTVRQMGYFGPGSALLAYTCTPVHACPRERIHLEGHGGFASRFHQRNVSIREQGRRARLEKILETRPPKLFFYEGVSDRNFITRPRKE